MVPAFAVDDSDANGPARELGALDPRPDFANAVSRAVEVSSAIPSGVSTRGSTPVDSPSLGVGGGKSSSPFCRFHRRARTVDDRVSLIDRYCATGMSTPTTFPSATTTTGCIFPVMRKRTDAAGRMRRR